MNKELSDFAARVRKVISSGGHCFVTSPSNRSSDEALSSRRGDMIFNQYALELFVLQFRTNTAYRKICEADCLTPETVVHWTQIPAVPTSAFKELELTCLPPEERTMVFHSSGTTEQKPSRHFHSTESLNVYETSLLPWFRANVWPDLRPAICDLRLIFLSPPPEGARHSSLVHMFETVRRKLGTAESVFVGKAAPDGTWNLDIDAALAALNASLVAHRPSLILGAAFSFVHLLDALCERDLRFRLPPGSRVMETGGYKNRSRAIPKEELHARITRQLGITPENILCEYGMSELSSQAYDSVTSGEWRVTGKSPLSRHPSPATRHFRFPPWARVQIISPETGREVAEGETGLIQVLDLANVFSVLAVQTEDLGVRRGDGFELIGRAQSAEPRGCSLMMNEPLAPALSPPGGARVTEGRVRG